VPLKVETTKQQQQGAVLIVDDNPLIVNVLKSLLASENYEVYSSTNGQEASDALAQKNIDVIICDVMMPKMDGYQFHKHVREKAEFSHIPFIFLTALDDKTEVNKGKETGVDDYIAKPFDPRALLASVKGKMQRSQELKNLGEERFDVYRKRVIHTLSHEFRTPLVAINTGAELLMQQQNRLEEGKITRLLEAIHRGGMRLERLVNDFMLLQQIEAGIAHRLFENRSAKRELFEVVEDFVAANQEMIKKEGFTLNVIDQSRSAEVKIYEPQVHDILTRLISNSIKFHGAERSIEIHVYRVELEAVVEIRDRGIGINPDRVKEAIDVFGQIDRDKVEQQGGGLGLAIASRYASIHGGRIEFESRAGGGSIVSLVLPIV
jgi:two-component system, sensor histidine kinase and response regulator